MDTLVTKTRIATFTQALAAGGAKKPNKRPLHASFREGAALS
jgi:hypothetical protein